MDQKKFAHSAIGNDLTDSEVSQVFTVIEKVRLSYAGKRNTVENLDALRDETLTRLMEIGILATMDPAPCFYGEPPVVEIIGKVPSDSVHKHGYDHEKEYWEVNKANERKEDWLGQKEKVNKRKK
jgi:hypothetical protein